MRDRIIIVVIILIFSLSGCNIFNGEPDEPDIIKEPTIGGEITLGLNDFIIDPCRFLTDKAAINKLDLVVYRGLLKNNEDLELKTDLVDSYLIDKDSEQIKLILKDNIKWQDGTDITVEDVKYTYEYYCNTNYNGGWKKYSFNISGTEAYRTGKEDNVSGIIISEEDQSIIIQYEDLTAKDLEFLTAPILSKNQLNDNTPKEIKELSLAGDLFANGCYKIDLLNDENMVLVRNDYFEDEVYLDKITVSKSNGNDKYNLELVSPQDIITVEETETTDKNKDNETKKEVLAIEGEGYQYLGMNLNSSVFSDIEVRKAIKTLINYEELIENAYQGYGDEVYSPLHPKSWTFVSTELSYDKEEAKSILENKNLSLDFAYQDTSFFSNIAEELARQIEQYGVSLKLIPIAQEDYISKLFSKGEYDLFLASWAYEIDPIYENSKWLKKNDVLLGGYNVSHVNDEISDQYLLAGENSLSIDERKEIYKDWQEYFMNQCYIIPIASPQIIFSYEPTLHVNIVNSLTPYIDVQNWWIEKTPQK